MPASPLRLASLANDAISWSAIAPASPFVSSILTERAYSYLYA
ncbi:hypothetical protein [Oxynema aestuarii]|nr:hypothetical protein [Oxynema aestuarii]